jgi:hypothetical protein
MIQRSEQYPEIKWARVPAFTLIHAQPKVKIPGTNKIAAKTHAFSIQVLAKDTVRMNQVLCMLYSNDKLYLPYSMAKTFPTAVAKAILQQNQLLKDTLVIALLGIHRELMPHIANNIHLTPGILGVSDTPCTDKTG